MMRERSKQDDKQRQVVMQNIKFHMDIKDCICQPCDSVTEGRVHCSIKRFHNQIPIDGARSLILIYIFIACTYELALHYYTYVRSNTTRPYILTLHVRT